MIKGIHTSATAMRQGILRQEMTATNLANAGTSGYKREHLFVQEMIAASAAENDPLQLQTGQYTDFVSGAFNPTGDSFDFALQNRGFFVLSDGQNETYTRAGHFQRNADGLFVDSMGRAVQGEGGDITLPMGLLTVSPDGQISVDGTVIDRFRVVVFENPQTLQRTENASFRTTGETTPPTPVENASVRQGFLEMSNVDTVREMVEMISTARNYEINARVLTAQDDTLKQTVGELARV